MTDPTTPDLGFWSNVAALGAGVAALFKSFRNPQRHDIHALRNRSQAVELRTSILETEFKNIDRRLTSIEGKLDRALGTR